MQLIVLGMHRSGTSSITGLLNMAGAYFGEPGIATEANEENPKGFFERRDVRAVCDGLLRGAGFDWWRVAGYDPDAIPDDVRDRSLGDFRSIVEEMDRHPTWVMKEPRLCLLLPILRPVLRNPVCVLVTRDPIEVAQSIHARSGYPVQAGLALWELYVGRSLSSSMGLPRVHVRYEDLMADPNAVTSRLLELLADLDVTGLHEPLRSDIDRFIVPELHRQRPSSRRGERLNRSQALLAAAIDEGRLLDLDPGPVAPLSAGSQEMLEVLEDDQDRRALVASMEATARVERLRTDAIERRLTTVERLYQDLRQRAARPILLIAGTRTLRAAKGARANLHELAGSGSGATGPVARAVAAAEDVARRVMATDDIASDGAPRPVSVLRTRAALPPTGRPSVAVIAWDVGHNPLGRAMILAEILDRRFDVEIWGAQFERYGSDVWEPLRHSRIPVNVFEGRSFPGHMAVMQEIAGRIDADAVYVSKPRLPSLLLGVLAKEARNRPLVLDVDDRELSFFAEDAGLDVRRLLDKRGDAALDLPFERAWTRACDPVITEADAVTVSNPTLQHLYGGTVVPHARDETVFDPAVYDRAETRAALGVDDETRLLLFGGTPRAHKGVLDVLRAIDRLGDERYRLMVFGSRQLDEMQAQIGDLARWALPLPQQPFTSLARTVAAADLACVLQDPDHPVTAHQLPAKITDALAMEVPCLVSPAPPLEPLMKAGVLQVLDPGDSLHERIAGIFDDPVAVRERAREGRRYFCDELSYEAVSASLSPVFQRLLAKTPPLSPKLGELADVTRKVTAPARRSAPDAATPAPRPSRPARQPGDARHPVVAGEPFDVVMFWKQNDTGIYGRRQDMFLKYLQRTGRVRSIVHFDNPLAPETMAKWYLRSAGSTTDQRRLILRRTMARLAHRRDTAMVWHRTFLHAGSASSMFGLAPRDSYASYVKTTLARRGIGQRPLVLWAYPSNLDLPELIDTIRPDMVVTDVVDDNRTWTKPGSAEYGRIEANYEAVIARSDVVIANCEPVAERLSHLAGAIHVVPNGCELPDNLPDGPRPRELAELTGPIIGYVGNLSSRLDVPLLEAVARARPQWQIVLIGSTHLDRSILRLESVPNVHFIGVRPYEEALRFVRHFDVALIPHLDNEMTRAMNPLKAFVYASAGVPVVSTPIANIDELTDVITVAEGREAFIAAIDAAVDAGRHAPDLDVLMKHSWDSRVQHVLELIDQAAVGEGG